MALLLAAALTLTACTGEKAKSEPVIALPPAQVTGVESIEFPIFAYYGSSTFAERLDKARAVLHQRCLEGFGITVRVQPWGGARPDNYVWSRYGLADEAAEARTGYRFGGTVSAPTYEIGTDWMGTPGVRELMGGDVHEYAGKPVPEGGCQGWAWRELGPLATTASEDVPEKIFKESLQLSMKDSRVVAKFVEWRDCFSRAGHQADGPWEAARAFSGRSKREPVQPDEVAAAVADMRCKRETGLLDLWVAVDLAYQRRLIDENAERLAEVKTSWAEAERRIAQVLSGG